MEMVNLHFKYFYRLVQVWSSATIATYKTVTSRNMGFSVYIRH